MKDCEIMKLLKSILILLSSTTMPLKAMENTSPSLEEKIVSPTKNVEESANQEILNKYYAEKHFLPVVKDLDPDNPKIFESYEAFISAPFSITGYKKNMDWNTCWKKFWEPLAKIDRSLIRPKPYNLETITKEMDALYREKQDLDPRKKINKYKEKETDFLSESFSFPFENDNVNKPAESISFLKMDASFLSKAENEGIENPVPPTETLSVKYKAMKEKEEADNLIRTANMQKDTFVIESDLRYIQEYYKNHYPDSIFGGLSKEKEDQIIESAVFLIKNGKILDEGEALKKAFDLVEAGEENIIEKKNIEEEEKIISLNKLEHEIEQELEKEIEAKKSADNQKIILNNYVYIHDKLIEQYNGLMGDYTNAINEIAALKEDRLENQKTLLELQETHLEDTIKLKDALAEIANLKLENNIKLKDALDEISNLKKEISKLTIENEQLKKSK